MLQNRSKTAAAAISTTTITTTTSNRNNNCSSQLYHHHHHHQTLDDNDDDDKQHQNNNNNKSIKRRIFQTFKRRRRRRNVWLLIIIIAIIICWIQYNNQHNFNWTNGSDEEDEENAAAIRRAKKRQEQKRQRQTNEKKKKKTHNNNNNNILTNRNDPLMKHGTWDISPIVIESHGLVFFSVPKIAATTFKQLFRRILQYKNWNLVTPEGNIPHNPSMNGLTYLCDFSIKKANYILMSQNYTKAIFIRDPKARLVSAYKDKALQHNAWYIKTRFCGINSKNPYGPMDNNIRPYCKFLTPNNKTITSSEFTFERFLKDFVIRHNDPHWEPQYQRVNAQIWDQMTFIGRFENLYEDSKTLLMKIGAWEKYGSNGWGNDGTSNNNTTNIVVGGGGDAIFESNTAKHKTSSTSSSSSSSTSLDKLYYNTPEIKKLFYDYYRNDYQHPIMNFTKPVDYQSSFVVSS